MSGKITEEMVPKKRDEPLEYKIKRIIPEGELVGQYRDQVMGVGNFRDERLKKVLGKYFVNPIELNKLSTVRHTRKVELL